MQYLLEVFLDEKQNSMGSKVANIICVTFAVLQQPRDSSSHKIQLLKRAFKELSINKYAQFYFSFFGNF